MSSQSIKKGIIVILLLFAGAIVFLPQIVIFSSAKDHIYTLKDIPERPIGIVFGASVVGNLPSDILADRLEKAAELYHAGKVEMLLMSGDSRSPDYSEVEVMKQSALILGVAPDDIRIDGEGLSTVDSCHRAAEVYAISAAILITQKFHLPRALYACEKMGIDVVGYAADKHVYEKELFNEGREFFARIEDFFEAW